MPERDQPGVPAQHVPGEAKAGPDQHEREHELVIGVGDEEGERRISDGEGDDRCNGARKGDHQVRSTTRPKKPCGMRKMTSKKTTKMAAFCSCVGSTRVESCWTSPMVIPPQKAPMMLPMPPRTTPAY